MELSHFAHRTIRVQEGQWVERGALLGLCGNSGYSAQPHIHVQVQADARIGAATLPFSFVSYRHGDIYHANDLPREADDVEPLVVEQQLDEAATFLPDSVQQFEVLRGGRPAGKVAFRVAIAADGTHYFQSDQGWLYFGKHEGTFYFYRLEGDDPCLRLVLLALPRLPLAFKPRLAWNDSIPAGMAVTGIPRLLARLGNLVWPRLAYVEISQRFVDRYCVESSLQHPLLGATGRPAWNWISTAGLLPSKSATSNSNASAPKTTRRRPFASQPRSHKRRRLMSVTAIACLASPGGGRRHDGTTGSTTAHQHRSPGPGGPETLLRGRAERDYAKGIAAFMEQYEAHRRDYALNLRLGWLNYLRRPERRGRALLQGGHGGRAQVDRGQARLPPAAAGGGQVRRGRGDRTANRRGRSGELLRQPAAGRGLAAATKDDRRRAGGRAADADGLPDGRHYLAELAALGEVAKFNLRGHRREALAAFGESYAGRGPEATIRPPSRRLAQQHAVNPKDYLLNLRLGWLNYLNRDYAKSARYYQSATRRRRGRWRRNSAAMLAELSPRSTRRSKRRPRSC